LKKTGRKKVLHNKSSKGRKRWFKWCKCDYVTIGMCVVFSICESINIMSATLRMLDMIISLYCFLLICEDVC
jgi:hypothetical protein